MNAYILGVACTRFGNHTDRSFKELATEVVRGVVMDAGLEDGSAIDSAWFANAKMDVFGQSNTRGQIVLSDAFASAGVSERVPVINVEGACCSGGMALRGAWAEARSGTVDLSLAVAVEKNLISGDPVRQARMFTGGNDAFDPHQWHDYYRRWITELTGAPPEPGFPDNFQPMQSYAMQALHRIQSSRLTVEQMAAVVVKSREYGALNPLAQLRKPTTVDEVLSERMIVRPLTRPMCAPVSDGAAAVLICSERALAGMPAAVRERAVLIRAIGMANGKYRTIDEPTASHFAAKAAYLHSGATPADIDIVEVHNATALGEFQQLEMLGLCAAGMAAPLIEAGETVATGRIPTNMSGGLLSKGHPVGATGLSMVQELVTQLRGEAGPRQVAGARIGMAQNSGGTTGFDDAVSAVTILEMA